jgi:ribose transport system substrate-binding protein
MKAKKLAIIALVLIFAVTSVFAAGTQEQDKKTEVTGRTEMASADAKVDDYVPESDSYRFSYLYKLIHPWYDAIKVGLDAAVADYAEKGVTVEYEYLAPVNPDGVQQLNMIEAAAGKGFDVIAVDITNPDVAVPVLNEIMDNGTPVLTFAGGDASPDSGSNRIAFIGNVDNKGDGAALAEALAKKIGYEGQVAALTGTIGAPSHEQRIEGFEEVMAKYPKIEVVARQRDNDELEKAITMTENIIQRYPKLKGVWANNMTNPIGAAVAVDSAGKAGDIIIVGMDHDLRALEYLRDGVIYTLQIQNNFDMGYELIRTSIKVADGHRPDSGLFPELHNVGSTTIYQEDAEEYIDLLY